jgi:hypothetical protein
MLMVATIVSTVISKSWIQQQNTTAKHVLLGSSIPVVHPTHVSIVPMASTRNKPINPQQSVNRARLGNMHRPKKKLALVVARASFKN